MRNESGTIAAISTAMSNSGIGIVRMSGEEAVEIAERIYKGKNEKKLKRIVNMLYLFYKKLTKKPLIRGKLSVPNGPILVNGE